MQAKRAEVYRLALSCAALLFLTVSPSGCQPPGETTSLKILYTASLKGALDGCSCERAPVAGLITLASFLRAQKSSQQSLLLDAGDILPAFPDPDLTKEILETYRELGYDAVAVGEAELSSGSDALLRFSKRFPLVSNNLSLRNLPISPRPILITRNSLRIGIISITDPDALQRNHDFQAGLIRLADPFERTRALVSSCRRNGAMVVIVLFHGSEERALLLAEECSGIDVILFGHQGRKSLPIKVRSTILASPGEQGNNLGILTLKLSDGGMMDFEHQLLAFSYGKDPRDPGVLKRSKKYVNKLLKRIGSDAAQ